MQPESDSSTKTRKREEHLSKDGKWRSFPKVPGLLQYVSSGKYYGRIKVGGKLKRESLQTTVWTTANLKLLDFKKKHQENQNQGDPPKFSRAVELLKQELENDVTIKASSKEYRLRCLNKIQETWPDLDEMRIHEIPPLACKEWATKLHGKIASHYYNNTIATLRQIIQLGIKEHKQNGGAGFENPAAEIKRVRVKQKELKLPESSQFHDLVDNLRKGSGGWGPRVGDVVEFLSYSGMRIHSEAIWVTWDDIDWKRDEIIVRGHPETRTKNNEIRRIPILPDMKILLERLKDKLGKVSGQILQVSRCNESLARACEEIGIPKITHHDLRHLFATKCIEANVPIPTVSHWLGHKDGGALAMKTYGHLRNEHSKRVAEGVKF